MCIPPLNTDTKQPLYKQFCTVLILLSHFASIRADARKILLFFYLCNINILFLLIIRKLPIFCAIRSVSPVYGHYPPDSGNRPQIYPQAFGIVFGAHFHL